MSKGKFEFFEHTADIIIVAHGETLEEAFENAALATFEVMTDTKKIEGESRETVEVDGFDHEALLYNWIETLLVRFETTGNIYSEFTVKKIQKTDSGYKLKAILLGEKFDPKKHPSKVGVKAITYHRMKITQTLHKSNVRFVLDI
ncbi:MAG: archease [Candidatus Bathyarchaeota archaeon]|nr:MAG: archease [Candidatus Bathyarchaeota archaeon]